MRWSLAPVRSKRMSSMISMAFILRLLIGTSPGKTPGDGSRHAEGHAIARCPFGANPWCPLAVKPWCTLAANPRCTLGENPWCSISHKLTTLAAEVPAEQWERRSAGEGAKGPRVYDWTRVPIRPLREPGWEYWLLVRRSLSDPTDLAYYVCFSPQGTPLAELVRVAGTRWAIEEGFESTKGEVGLDQYEVRRWTGWYRHITLALLAHAYLTVTRAVAERGGVGLRTC